MTMSDIKNFCHQTSRNLMNGISQELKLYPGQDYQPRGYNSGRVLELRMVGVNPAHLPKIQKLGPRLSLWAGLPEKYKIRVGHNGRAITLEIPKPKDYWKQITIDGLVKNRLIKSGPVATVGLGLQDDPQRVDFKQPDVAHVFLAGATRSGKTNLQKLMAWNLIKNNDPEDIKMIIIDVAAQGVDWLDFVNLPHLINPLITDLQKAEATLAWVEKEMTKRGKNRQSTPKLFVIIDEVKSLIEDSEVAGKYLSRLSSLAGKFGIHLILATQYPQISMLKSAELKRNVTTRFCGRVDDALASQNALGIPKAGGEMLGGYGDFLYKSNEALTRLTVPHLQSKHMKALPRVETPKVIELPDQDYTYSGPIATRQPDPLEPEQVALALYKPIGINKLQSELGIGSNKAQRVKAFADSIKVWAVENGYKEQ